MLSKVVVVLCFSFALASAVDGLRSLQNQADEARLTLSSLPAQCTADSHQLITAEYVNTLHSIFNCSYTEVINGAANIALETGAYIVMDYKTIKELVVKFTKCATELNPLKVAECDYREVVSAYAQIKDLLVSTANFITDMKAMIPPLKAEIHNCLRLSSMEYKVFLNNLINNARTCAKHL